jgi:hypothetical protein
MVSREGAGLVFKVQDWNGDGNDAESDRYYRE